MHLDGVLAGVSATACVASAMTSVLVAACAATATQLSSMLFCTYASRGSSNRTNLQLHEFVRALMSAMLSGTFLGSPQSKKYLELLTRPGGPLAGAGAGESQCGQAEAAERGRRQGDELARASVDRH